jgi:effector-binding domain-containing protein/uncharacterized protein YndB with AHSA1/START domain
MKLLKKILITLVVIVGLLALVGLFLPKDVHVERSFTFNAPAEAVYKQVNNMKNWTKWSTWHRIDPNMKIEYSGPEEGTGSSYKWSSDNKDAGHGNMKIVADTPHKVIMTEMQWEDMTPSQANWYFTDKEGKTEVKWTMEAHFGDPFSRYFGLFFDAMLGPDYEKSLKNLDSVVKAEPMMNSVAYKIQEVDVRETPMIFKHVISDMKNMSANMGGAYGAIMASAGKQGLTMTGAPFAIWYSWENDKFEFDAGIAYNKMGKDEGDLKAGKINATKALKVDYYGAYEKSELAHTAIKNYIKEKGITMNGAPWEVYVTDPEKEKDPSKILTEVYYPIK